MDGDHSGDDGLQRFLALIAGDRADGRFIDVRWRQPGDRMRRRFVAARDLDAALALVRSLCGRCDVYTGVALRDGDVHGGRAAIGGSHIVWVESDDVRTAARLIGFADHPTMIVASGTPGHVQLYWRLDRPRSLHEVEAANRKLATALSGDTACSDGARILRPPGTWNHKHRPPRRVTLLAFNDDNAYPLEDLTAGRPAEPVAPHPGRPDVPRRESATPLDRWLLAIPAHEYVRALTGRHANREGKVLCPFHDDRTPSLQLYPDGGFYCFGSGCRTGGTIFDFAGRLWNMPTRGTGFLALRRRLDETFTPTTAPRSVGLAAIQDERR